MYLALGGFGFEAVTKFFGLKPRPKFGHGLEVQLSEGRWLVGCYHVSQQNTFTGRLTGKMLDEVMRKSGVAGWLVTTQAINYDFLYALVAKLADALP